ncbi:zinc finger, C2H2 type [Cooperia oncophora]
MATYPVIFRCSECTIEIPTLELLESHIWSRHLHNFPFSCAICRFPAIAHSSLAAHFKQVHSPGQVCDAIYVLVILLYLCVYGHGYKYVYGCD